MAAGPGRVWLQALPTSAAWIVSEDCYYSEEFGGGVEMVTKHYPCANTQMYKS